MPSRITGVSKKKQKELSNAIKKARFLSLISYTNKYTNPNTHTYRSLNSYGLGMPRLRACLLASKYPGAALGSPQAAPGLIFWPPKKHSIYDSIFDGILTPQMLPKASKNRSKIDQKDFWFFIDFLSHFGSILGAFFHHVCFQNRARIGKCDFVKMSVSRTRCAHFHELASQNHKTCKNVCSNCHMRLTHRKT